MKKQFTISEMYHAMGRVADRLEDAIFDGTQYLTNTQRTDPELSSDFMEYGLLQILLEKVEELDFYDAQRAYERGRKMYLEVTGKEESDEA